MLKRTQCLEGLPHLPLGKTQVVMALKVEPEFGARAEEMTEAQRGIAGDGALAIQYSGNPIGRYVQLARELCRAHVERVQFLGEVLAGGIAMRAMCFSLRDCNRGQVLQSYIWLQQVDRPVRQN